MAKPALVTIIILGLSVFAFFNLSAPAYANPCNDNPCPVAISQPVNVGDNTIFFRDINTLDNSTATVSLDKNTYLTGQTATLTINDFNENLDINAKDTITAQVTPVGNVLLTETGNDTGIFQGSFVVSSSPSVSYTPELNTGRLKLTFDGVTTPGTVEFKDLIINSINGPNLPLIPVVHPVHINLAGAALGPGGIGVNMSYANALLGDPNLFTEDLIQMCYKPDGGSWQLVTDTDDNISGYHDFNSKTITNDAADFGAITQSGLVTLCFNFGSIGGGGSSGLLTAGFVLNFLAGAGAAEHSVTPPSFGGSYVHYSDGLTFTQGSTKTTFDTSKYNQDLQRQVMVAGTPVNMTFKTYEGYSYQGVVHMGLYVIPRGQDMITSNSLASITWDKGQQMQVNDPNHILSNATASSNSDGKFQYTQFSFIPTKSYDKMSFLARAWNDHLQSTDIRVHDEVEPPQTPYTKPYWLHVYVNLHDADMAIEGAGFAKPHIFSHVSTSDQVWNQNGGTVLWFWDTKDQAVALQAYDSNKNVVWIQSELLSKDTPQIAQGPESSYAGNHLSRQDTTALENAQKAEQDRVDTTLQMLGYPVYWNHSIGP